VKKLFNKRFVIVILIICGLIFALLLSARHASAPRPENTNNLTADTAPQFDKSRYSIDDPSSLWVVVNKQRPISLDFKPDDLVTPKVLLNPAKSAEENQLRQEVAESLAKMFVDAKKSGVELMMASGYRSADLQSSYYNGYVARDGQKAADRYSAKPGTSEHQTGLSLDISRKDRQCYLEICFGKTVEGKWLANNAHIYGFILRYKKGAEDITGYQYEPWHFRYVGTDLSVEIKKTNQTLEEFFGI
jgi:zinc D-Ala-D-Ala carboxypeptidase